MIAASAVARSGAVQTSRRSALAVGWTDLGSLSSTLAVLWTVQRWCRVVGDTSSRAFQKPSAPSPVASSGATAKPRAFDQQLPPALRALAHADLEAQELLLALGRRADQHQHALGLRLHARLQVDAVCPDIHVAPGRQVAPLPARIVHLPFVPQPCDHR